MTNLLNLVISSRKSRVGACKARQWACPRFISLVCVRHQGLLLHNAESRRQWFNERESDKISGQLITFTNCCSYIPVRDCFVVPRFADRHAAAQEWEIWDRISLRHQTAFCGMSAAACTAVSRTSQWMSPTFESYFLRLQPNRHEVRDFDSGKCFKHSSYYSYIEYRYKICIDYR
jgi:hypothetical protein